VSCQSSLHLDTCCRDAAKMSEKGILDYLAFWPRHDDVYQRFRPAMSLMRGRFAFE
jgi:hypothetical protein